MKRTLRGLAFLAPLAVWGAACRADIIYDTTPFWNGSDGVAAWGSVQSGFTPTFGQTFVAPSVATEITDFTFFVTNFSGVSSVTFQGAIFAWSGSLIAGNAPQGALGPPLFAGTDRVFVDNGNFQAVTIQTGGIVLDPGASYVALLTTSGPGAIASNGNSLDFFEWGLAGPNSLPNDGGGGFNFFNNMSFDELGGGTWDSSTNFGDLAWTAHFAVVPEPDSLILITLGLAGLTVFGVLSRFRRPKWGDWLTPWI